MSHIRAASHSVLIKMVSTLATVLGGFALSVLLNRHFGQEPYGLLVLVYTVTGFAFSVSDLGAKQTLIRYLPPLLSGDTPGKSLGPLLGVALLVQLGGALLLSALMAIGAGLLAEGFFQKGALTALLWLGASYFFCFAMHDFFVQLAQAFQAWKREAVLSITFVLLQLVTVGVGIWLFDISIKWVLVLNGCSAMATACLGLALMPRDVLREMIRGARLRYLSEYGPLIRRFGFPLVLVALNFYLLGWADKAMLGRSHPAAEVTIYYLGWLIVNGLMTMFKILPTVFLPYVSEISVKDEAYLCEKFQVLFRWFLHVCVLCVLAMFFLIEPLVLWAFGPGYLGVVRIVRVLLLVFLARGIWHVSGMFLVNAFNLVKPAVWLGNLLVLANLIFNVILVPRWGAMGAAVSGVMAYAIYWGLATMFASRVLRMVPLQSVAKAVGAIGVVAVVSAWVMAGGNHPYALAWLSPALYLIALVVFREVAPKDITLAKQIVLAVWPQVGRSLAQEEGART